MGGSPTARELYQQKALQIPATEVGTGANGEMLSAPPAYPMLKKEKAVTFDSPAPMIKKEKAIAWDSPKQGFQFPMPTGTSLTDPTADFPSDRSDTQNKYGRDSSATPIRHKKDERPLNARTADWPDERK